MRGSIARSLALLLALLATALPSLPIDLRWVRVVDFPRLQIQVAMAALLAGTILAAAVLMPA